MSDDVKALAAIAQEILDRAKGQIGTHWTDCYKYHLACFAAFAIDALEAAQQEIAALTAEADRAIDQANNLAGDLAVQQAPAVDREAFDEALQQWSGNGSVFAHLVASGILQDAAEVEARGLETVATIIENPRPGKSDALRRADVVAALRSRADQRRKGLPLDPEFRDDLLTLMKGTPE